MTTWQQLADNLKTDSTLTDLTNGQVEAIIDVLTLIIHADEHVGFMEEMEFDQLLMELPWLEDKAGKVEAWRESATDKAEAVDGEEEFMEIATSAAAELDDDEVRERVFTMAAGLCSSDGNICPDESEALHWLGRAFGLDSDQIEELINDASSM